MPFDQVRAVQRRLQRLYDLPSLPPAEDFLCSEQRARDVVGEVADRGEVLIVRQTASEAEVGLYLDPRALNPSNAQERAWMEEGISHLVYLLFRGSHGQGVSELELEVQAEVDKYALGLLRGWGVGLIAARSKALRRELYEKISFIDDASTEQGHRYRKANAAAATYARKLEKSFLTPQNIRGLTHELRRFYRRGLRGKLIGG